MSRRNDSTPIDDEPLALAPALPYGPARVALDLAVRRLDEAEARREPAAMSEALAGIARCYRAVSAWAAALDYMQQALRWAHVSGGSDQIVELMCELAELAASTGEAMSSPDRPEARAARDCARDHAFEAARVAVHAADPEWEIKVLLRIADVLDRCGDQADAIDLQTRALSLMSRRPEPTDGLRVPPLPAPPQLM